MTSGCNPLAWLAAPPTFPDSLVRPNTNLLAAEAVISNEVVATVDEHGTFTTFTGYLAAESNGTLSKPALDRPPNIMYSVRRPTRKGKPTYTLLRIPGTPSPSPAGLTILALTELIASGLGGQPVHARRRFMLAKLETARCLRGPAAMMAWRAAYAATHEPALSLAWSTAAWALVTRTSMVELG